MSDTDIPESLLNDAAWLFLLCDQDESISIKYGIDLEIQVTDALTAFAREEPFSAIVSHIDWRHPSADSAFLGLRKLAEKYGRDTSLAPVPPIPVPPEIAFCSYAITLIDLANDLGPCDEVLAGLGAAAHLLSGGDVGEALEMVPSNQPHSGVVRQVLIGLPEGKEFVAFIARSQFVLSRYHDLRYTGELDDMTPLGRLFNDLFWGGYEGKRPVWDYLPRTDIWLCFW